MLTLCCNSSGNVYPFLKIISNIRKKIQVPDRAYLPKSSWPGWPQGLPKQHRLSPLLLVLWPHCEDTTDPEERVQRSQASTGLEALFLMASVHSGRRCYTGR